MKKILSILAVLTFMVGTAFSQTVDGYDFCIDGFAAYAGTPGNAWYHEGGTTGGQGGKVVKADDFAQLQAYMQSSDPYIILVDHDITTGIKCYVDDLSTGHLLDDQSGATGVETTYGERIMVASNKTLIGIADAEGKAPLISRITLVMQCTHNVIIRNCRFTMVGVPILKTGENKIVAWRDGQQVEVGDPDCIGIQADLNSASKDSGSHIWVDHCEFFNGGAANKDRYDGLLDCKNNVQWLTFSYNYFHNHDKSCLWGKGDSDVYEGCRTISAHHNMFENIDGSRLPLQRGGHVHYMNNYINGCADGWDLRSKSVGYADACYFKNSKSPILPDGGGQVNICQEEGYGIIYDNCKRVIKGTENISYKNEPSKYDSEFSLSSLNAISEWVPTQTVSSYFVNNRQKAEDVPAFCEKYSGAGKVVIWNSYAEAIPAASADDYAAATKTQSTAACYDAEGNKVAGIGSTGGGTGTGGGGSTSGDTIFCLEVSSSATDASVTNATDVIDLTSYCSTLTGGTAEAGIRATASSSQKVVGSDSSQRHIRFPKNDVFVKITLDTPLAAGDVITFSSNSAADNQICFMANSTYSNAAATVAHSYTIPSDSELVGSKVLYVSRAQSSSTYIQKLTIMRPTADGIDTITSAKPAKAVMYDLQGRRIIKAAKGQMYILNGKKYLQK